MYKYEEHRDFTNTNEGLVKMIEIMRDVTYAPLWMEFKMQDLLGSGDAWKNMACVERLVEAGLLREVTTPEGTFAQNRLFTR